MTCWKLKCGISFLVQGQPSAVSWGNLLCLLWISLNARETGLFLEVFTGLSVGFSVVGSIQKIGGYFHFISPISRSELTY